MLNVGKDMLYDEASKNIYKLLNNQSFTGVLRGTIKSSERMR